MASHSAASPSSRDTLVHRLVSAGVSIPIILLATFAGSVWFLLLVLTMALLGLAEFYRLARGLGARPPFILGIAWTTTLIITSASYNSTSVAALVILSGVLASLLWTLCRHPWHTTLLNWGITVAGPLHLGATLLHAPLLRGSEDGFAWVLVVLLGTFATDTSAYAAGQMLGRHQLAPRISPGKTWEGAAFGLIAPILVVLPISVWFDLPMSIWETVMLALAMGFVAQLGDLAESALKRASGTKESGHLIPGHGGILDRLDSLVFTIVLVYYFHMGVVL